MGLAIKAALGSRAPGVSEYPGRVACFPGPSGMFGMRTSSPFDFQALSP